VAVETGAEPGEAPSAPRGALLRLEFGGARA